MYSDDIREICLIINKRNELQKIRGSARFKVTRLAKIIYSKKQAKEKKRLERLLDPKTNKFNKVLKQVNSISEFSMPNITLHLTFASFKKDLKLSIEKGVESAEKELFNNRYKYQYTHPKKYDKISLHYLETKKQKHVMEREAAKYEIMLHTEETTKRLRQLLKKHKLRLVSDGSGGVESIRCSVDGKRWELYKTASEIKSIAFDVSVEEELKGK